MMLEKSSFDSDGITLRLKAAKLRTEAGRFCTIAHTILHLKI